MLVQNPVPGAIAAVENSSARDFVEATITQLTGSRQ
jgi:hypothetical protein